MKTIHIAATAAASVLCLSIGQAWAADTAALSSTHPPVGQRAADHWTPAAMEAATLQALPAADPAAVSAAAGPKQRADMPVKVKGATSGGTTGGAGGGAGGGSTGGGIGGSGDSGGGATGGGGTAGGGTGGGTAGGGTGGGTAGGGTGGGTAGGGTGGGTAGGGTGGGGLGGSGGSGGGGTGGGGGLGGGGGGAVANLPMWGGKLYFSTPQGDYVCEAQFVSNDVVMTAAQCIQDDQSGQYYTNFQFVQEPPGGQKTAYDYVCAGTFENWAKPGDQKWAYDMGMVKLKGESPVGSMGFTWNYQQIGPFGYVNKSDQVVAASGNITGKNGIVQMTPGGGADMLGGAAWMTTTESDNGQLQTAFSLLSFTDKNQPGVYFGPYFDDKIKTLFDYTENGCQ